MVPNRIAERAGVRGHRSSPGDRDSFTGALNSRPIDHKQQSSTTSIPTDAASAGFISRPALHLLLATATLAAIWLLLLPALLRLQPIRHHVDHLDAQGVDASAMYYTELQPEFLIDNRTACDAK